MWNPSLPLVSIEDAPARLGAGNPELQAMVTEAASGAFPEGHAPGDGGLEHFLFLLVTYEDWVFRIFNIA